MVNCHVTRLRISLKSFIRKRHQQWTHQRENCIKTFLEETFKRISIVFVPNKNAVEQRNSSGVNQTRNQDANADKIIFKGFSESHKFSLRFDHV